MPIGIFEAIGIMVEYVFCYRSECATKARKYFLSFLPTSSYLFTRNISKVIMGD
jgi:hypothetical protein